MNAHFVRRFAFRGSFLAVTAALCAAPQKIQIPAPSPESTLIQKVGLTTIEIKYSRPGAKGRKIFGGLEPFGHVWRTGANQATKISFSTPVAFGGTPVPAGEYALFSIPDSREWTVILNKVAGQWGAYKYDEKNDVARVKTRPVALAEPIETFTIGLNDLRDDSATLTLEWQKTRVSVKLQLDTIPVVVDQIKEAMASGRKLAPGEYDAAALFYLEHQLDLDQALGWIDAAIEAQPKGFYFYYHKARILAKKGDKAGTTLAARKSIELAQAQSGPVADEYVRLNQTLLASLGP